MPSFSFTRLIAFMLKESLQVIRDPSSIIIAIILPLLMIFLFAFGVSLDMNNIRIGLVLEDSSSLARSLAYAFENNHYFSVDVNMNRQAIYQKLASASIRGIVIIPQEFSALLQEMKTSPIQVIVDGGETNTANFVQNYAQGVVANWVNHRQQENSLTAPPTINLQTHVWFNPELKSRNVILPGSIAIIMALIGTLLTALVVAREWERGSMEAILSTPIHISELIIGKLLPYFFMGMGSMILCVVISVFVFGVPFVGSLFILSLATALFLLAALSQGLLISILSKNQFVASQTAINVAFLPAYMLSGFLYEINSMPFALQLVTYLLPARYFVSIIQSCFLTDVGWKILLPNMLAMFVMATFFISLATRKCKKSLE